jgi:hypothetical protein
MLLPAAPCQQPAWQRSGALCCKPQPRPAGRWERRGARAQRETASRIMYSDNIKFPAQHSRAWIDFVRRALVRP